MAITSYQTLSALGLALLLATVALQGAGQAQAKPSYPIVDTGQSTCYGTRPRAISCPGPGEAMHGQDAQYQGNQPSYRDNGDGTVSDLVTGLMWTKEFERNVDWSNAANVARTAQVGGHSDWRVPTTKELYSLILFNGTTPGPMTSSPRPYLDQSVFDFEYPSGQNMRPIDAQYIASTLYVGRVMRRARAFFGVNFADGRIKGYGMGGGPMRRGWYLRLVRGAPEYGKNAFRDNGNGTVTDDATGLIWSKGDSGDPALRAKAPRSRKNDGSLDWPEALAFCEALSLGGRTDWRLPNAKELQSILDYTRSPQTTDSAAIDPVFQATAITAENGQRDFPAYWTSTTHIDGPEGFAVLVHFGEALGSMRNSLPGGNGGGGGPNGGPPGGGGQQRFNGPPPGGPMGPGGRMRPPPGFQPIQFSGNGQGQGPGQGAGQGSGGFFGFGGGSSSSQSDPSSLMDVHGAGAQRSDPKVGDPSDYPKWDMGPQGDVRRVFNFARCVTGGP